VEIACNMPVSEGLRILTDSEQVRAYRKEMMQLVTLNHPVDCGICDKAGECTLQDYHYKYNGSPSVSREPKVRSTKFHALSERVLLDNERCILCSRCVRFTREISKSNALGITQRGDTSLVRASEYILWTTPTGWSTLPVGALLAAVPLQGARLVSETDSVRLPGLRPRLHDPDLASQVRMEAQRARPAEECQHRAHHAARKSGRERSVDLQQRARSRADLRAPARRAGHAEGKARRPGSGDRGSPAIDRKRQASRRGVELGLKRDCAFKQVLANASPLS
jgi:hypothetical protein